MELDFSINVLVPVSAVMTRNPRSIEVNQPLSTARQWMDQLSIRHLPVREGGKLVGIISDRDLNLVLGVTSKFKPDAGDMHSARVEDAMVSVVHELSEDTQVKDVSRIMLEHKIGSVLINDANGNLTGIFTETDALKILAGLA